MALVASSEALPVDLSVLVVSYNTKALTLEALESLLRFPPPVDFEVIVLDNASTDGSMDAIRDAFPQLHLIANPQNVGFAAANNLAAKLARGRRILLLNPDTVTLEYSHSAIWAFAEQQPDRGIWGGRTLFPDLTLNPTSCWRRMTLWSVFCGGMGLTHLFSRSTFFNSEAYGDWKRDQIRDVDIVTGCFLMIDTALWRRLGGFDPTFFMYAEEADLCLRAKALGARPGISPQAEIVHMGGMSEVTGADKIVKTARGRVTLMRKHWTPASFAAGKALMLLWSGLRYLGSQFLSGRRDAPGAARAKWSDVWRRRDEWLAGYDVAPSQ